LLFPPLLRRRSLLSLLTVFHSFIQRFYTVRSRVGIPCVPLVGLLDYSPFRFLPFSSHCSGPPGRSNTDHFRTRRTLPELVPFMPSSEGKAPLFILCLTPFLMTFFFSDRCSLSFPSLSRYFSPPVHRLLSDSQFSSVPLIVSCFLESNSRPRLLSSTSFAHRKNFLVLLLHVS